MTTVNKILDMLNLQDSMNAVVNKDWRNAGYPWYRAVYVEGAELLDHLGSWKWWKKGSPDIVQAQIELVDIWHFGLSMQMCNPEFSSLDNQALATFLALELNQSRVAATAEDWSAEEANRLVDMLVGTAASEQRFNIAAFARIMVVLDMDIDLLHRLYVGKNALNRFRQNNGYKDGTYVKVWNGEEDNVHLERILDKRPPGVESLFAWVMEQLNVTYRAAVGK